MNKSKTSRTSRNAFHCWCGYYNKKYSHTQSTEKQIVWEISRLCKKLDNE